MSTLSCGHKGAGLSNKEVLTANSSFKILIMYNMFMKDSDDEDEDEWFYDSIKRYKQLRMFDVENVIKQIELSDRRSICVVGEHRSGKHEILELSLPDKMTVAPSQEGLVKNSDLKMRSGGYTTAPVIQMKALWNQRKIVLSEREKSGASIYNLGSGDSDLISRVGSLTCDMVSPLVAVNSVGLVLLAAQGRKDFLLMDVNKNKIVHRASVAAGETQSWLEPSFVSDTTAALCNCCTGHVTLHDIRVDKLVAEIAHDNLSVGAELWRMGTTEDSKLNSSVSNVTKIGLVSSSGKLLVYDVRNCHEPLCKVDTGHVCAPDSVLPTLKFSPDDNSRVSVSGFDDKVYIYNTEPFRTVFVHDGHERQNHSGDSSFVTCHVWYRENTVISASENKSLHCWQFSSDTES